MEKSEVVFMGIVTFIVMIGMSLLLNLAITPLVNWAISLFKSDLVLTYWQVYGVWFVFSLLTGGSRMRYNKEG